MACLRDNFQNGVLLDGRYKTISPLNHGSFGMVFMAKDLHTNETVAIKCLTKKAASDDAGLDFAVDEKSEELTLHGRLGAHPNIVNLLRSFETEAHLYIVLEFCPQGDLYEAIRNGHGPLETEHVRQFMLQLVDAVAYIHNKGVYHRDIKPENIFLTKSGAMKLGDFGLATTENWTLETTVGSDRYMAPEQFDSAGAGYSPAQADIWAIGICLLNILFSRNPFTTPTEADPLFLDFSRDKQSLFDVFPSMSQDTYEVIVQCMNLDPKKRSLVGARAALQRVVSFTTSEEDVDDFCSAERYVMASANREPLRTPSIQSPQVEQGAFPWAKALHASPPHPIRQLSAIPDDESYTEDLFSKSGETSDWFSSVQTPSVSSMLNSSLGASMKSLHIGRPIKAAPRPIPKVSPMAGSLPINMAKPRSNLSSMSLVFGRKDVVSKSWSDMWDEDEEEEEAEAERTRQMQSLKELNSRTWSHDSKTDDCDTVDATPIATTPQRTYHNDTHKIHNDIDSDLAADGFFFQDSSPPKSKLMLSTRQSPPKRDQVDKWSALGERRRAYTGSSYTQKSGDFARQQRALGLGFNSYAAGVWDQYANHNIHHKSPKEKIKECPWNKGRDWNYWRREKRTDLADVEWVGGWQEAHS
ncbi:serine threonine protein [Colletotrichum truncatum]|uniref:Serine threonine protein n=1 Tax=Colletotrichum truncatum TaxID=5467 RepID=A0ACC3YIA5_COLTU|nr:serine threonine protein [Colletotrichum truncatum]KAF6794524.1 serine threonine protein [Colletotrichum truncatum]